MRVYAELAKAGFRRYARYRTAIAASAFTNVVFGLIRASLLLTAISIAGGPIGGYDALQAATYVWFGQALLGPLDVWGSSVEIGGRIKSGDIAVEFSRPVSIVGSSLAQNYGRAAVELLPRALPPLAIGLLLTGMHVPTSPAQWLMGVVAVVTATALCHLYYFTVHLIGLWVLEVRGFLVLAMTIQQVLCGFVVPVSWFPPWLRALADHSPFPAMFQIPADMFTETLTSADALAALGGQVAWTAALLGLALLVLRAGRRKVVIQGG